MPRPIGFRKDSRTERWRARLLLGFDWQDSSGFPGADLGELFYRQFAAGHDRQRHRQFAHGRRRLLVRILAQDENVSEVW